MKTTILGSTKPGYQLTTDEALQFAGHEAGICYMPDTLEDIFNEPESKTAGRVKMTLENYHHSVFGHPFFNFSFEGIPKILAMILNNEKVYTTSEKSARYTKMQTSGREQQLYEKWLAFFYGRINSLYPHISLGEANKLAQENARYLISVFTPATTMGYTVSLQQINYILGWMKDEIDRPTDDKFFIKLKPVLQEFYDQVYPLVGVKGLRDNKGRKLSLFAGRPRQDDEFGETYCVNTEGSFAYLAQAQRHRTIKYEICDIPEPDFNSNPRLFYTPRCLEQEIRVDAEWREDIISLYNAGEYPQGMLLLINERGTVEDFVMKCKERLRGRAQLETCLVTRDTLELYYEEVSYGMSGVRDYLGKFVEYDELNYACARARCDFPNFTCTQPCRFGPERCFTRLV